MPFATSARALAALALSVLSLAALPGGAAAQDTPVLPLIGVPEPGGMGFQPAASNIAVDLQWLDGLILVIITAITIFVTALLVIVIVRYNSRANPEPASFTHNTRLEIAWTLGPVLILFFIGAFSLPVLFKQQVIPEADVTIKATGYQWYWGYEYPDHEFGFESFMIGSPATSPGGEDENGNPRPANDNRLTPQVIEQLEAAGYSREHFLLATDTAMVVPVNKTIVVQVTAADVIHSWTIPAFGVKQDGVPGRLAELWFTPTEEGVFFGQCSELCGIAHAYMPITVKVVSEEAYEEWLDGAIEAYAGTPRPVTVAAAD